MPDAIAKSQTNVIDVRDPMPAHRHETIFQRSHALAPGSFLILVNDHDPKPLYYQIKAGYQFSPGPISNAARRRGESRSASQDTPYEFSQAARC